MDIEASALAGVALITAIGAIIKNVSDIKQLKKWICYKYPCPDRLNEDPGPKTDGL